MIFFVNKNIFLIISFNLLYKQDISAYARKIRSSYKSSVKSILLVCLFEPCDGSLCASRREVASVGADDSLCVLFKDTFGVCITMTEGESELSLTAIVELALSVRSI